VCGTSARKNHPFFSVASTAQHRFTQLAAELLTQRIFASRLLALRTEHTGFLHAVV